MRSRSARTFPFFIFILIFASIAQANDPGAKRQKEPFDGYSTEPRSAVIPTSIIGLQIGLGASRSNFSEVVDEPGFRLWQKSVNERGLLKMDGSVNSRPVGIRFNMKYHFTDTLFLHYAYNKINGYGIKTRQRAAVDLESNSGGGTIPQGTLLMDFESSAEMSVMEFGAAARAKTSQYSALVFEMYYLSLNELISRRNTVSGLNQVLLQSGSGLGLSSAIHYQLNKVISLSAMYQLNQYEVDSTSDPQGFPPGSIKVFSSFGLSAAASF